MSAESSIKFRPSAFFPFVLSSVAFALVLILVFSGTNPESMPDGFLLSFNTTSVGQNLVDISPINPATPVASPAAVASATNAARDVRSALSSLTSKRSITNLKVLSSRNPETSNSTSPSLNITTSATSNSNTNSSSSTAPTLAIPQVAGPTTPIAIPIGLIVTFFQLTLNTLATGTGPLSGIVSALVTAQKQSLGVNQFYTMHLTGICQGSVTNATQVNATNPFITTRCVSYFDAGIFVQKITSNVSDSTFIAATNITVPVLSKVPSVGKQIKSIIDLAAGVVLAVFIIALIGNGISIILSAAVFFMPLNGTIFLAGAGITTLSTQLLQVATITSTTISIGLSSSINSFSNVSGFHAMVGGKFLGLIWGGYIAAQLANGYWINVWFVKFRTISYKARLRTPTQMLAGYKAIGKEVLSDLRLPKEGEEDTEVLIPREVAQVDIEHWNDKYSMKM